MANVLIVDDDRTVGGIVLSYLRRAGLEGRFVTTGADMRTALAATPPDLVVLDVMLPDSDGVELCAQLHEDRPHLPVILLTARTEESDRIAGLSAGADDYVVKPFSPRELVLRIQSVLRRAQQPPTPAPQPAVLSDGDLVLDRGSHTAALDGRALQLTVREFDLLAHLMTHPGRAFTRDELLAEVWGWAYGDKSTVTVHVRRLREKVEADPGMPTRLATVWGVGYRWDPADQPTAAVV